MMLTIHKILAIELNWINLDTKNPSIVSFTASAYLVTSATNQLKFTAIFDEPMDPNGALALEFINAAGIETGIRMYIGIGGDWNKLRVKVLIISN